MLDGYCTATRARKKIRRIHKEDVPMFDLFMSEWRLGIDDAIICTHKPSRLGRQCTENLIDLMFIDH